MVCPWGASQDSALSSLNRLAEKYRECLSNKEKILKEIEVKKEYLSSLQPRLNSIMQVRVSPQPATSLAFTWPSPPSDLGPPAATLPCGFCRVCKPRAQCKDGPICRRTAGLVRLCPLWRKCRQDGVRKAYTHLPGCFHPAPLPGKTLSQTVSRVYCRMTSTSLQSARTYACGC